MTQGASEHGPSPAAQRWAWALNLLVLLPVLPLLVGLGFVVQHDVFISDLLHSQLPYKAYLGRALAEGHWPLWMPDIFSGVPFLASIEAAPLFPPHALLFGLLDPYAALGPVLCLELVAAALGAWFVARRAGAGPLPAVLAGLAFAWSGFMVTHVRHLNMHAAAAILPWMVLAAERLIATQGRRGGIALAILLGLQVLAGHPQLVYITGLLLAARLGFHWLRTDWRQAWRSRLHEGLAFGAAMGLGAALAAIQLVPSWAFTQQSLGKVEPTWTYATAFPCPPRDLLALIWPPLVGAMETYDYDYGSLSTIPWGNYGYGGLVALVLAGVALALGWRRRIVLFWGAMLTLASMLVVGPHTPLYRVAWELLPGMKMFRFPTRFLVVSGLALAVLGAIGLDLLLRRAARRWPPRVVLGMGLAVLLLALLDLQHHQLPRLPIDQAQAWRDVGGPAGIPTGQGPDGRVLVLDEFDIWERAFHRAKGTLEGLEPYRPAWSLPLGSAGVLHDLHSASGYARMVHYRCAAAWQEYNRDILPQAERPERPSAENPTVGQGFQAQLDRGGVRWLLSPIEVEGGNLVHRGRHVLFHYENPSVLPRAYLAETWHGVDSFDEASAWLMGDGAATPALPVVEGIGPSVVEGGEMLASATADPSPQQVEVTLPDGAPAGLVVLADTWDPGWSVVVDGQEADLLVANGYQRAVQVSEGARSVVFRYRPAGLTGGLVGSGVAALLLLVWGVVGRWRRAAATTSHSADGIQPKPTDP